MADDYARRYAESIRDRVAFWARIAQRLDWIRAPTAIEDVSFDAHDFHIRWYADGVLNACANCLDRHLATRGDKVALVCADDGPAGSRRITYRELHAEVCRFALTLRHLGIARGERVAIYLPMMPEAVVAMLACARIGAVHVAVPSDCAPGTLAACLADAGCRLVVTADGDARRGAGIPFKDRVDEALTRPGTNSVETVIVVRHTGRSVNIQSPRDRWYDDLMHGQSTDCAPEPMRAEDPLFILYATDAAGKLAGMVHTTGGYLVYASHTHAAVFDLQDDDVYWCMADAGSIVGHSYGVYGPLANGATVVMSDHARGGPDAARCRQVIERHRVTVLCAESDAIRSATRDGDGAATQTSRPSLRLLGMLGAPIDAPTRAWYRRVADTAHCRIVEAWAPPEAGGILIASLPGTMADQRNLAGKPLFGIQPALVDAHGTVLDGACAGKLVITEAWPGQMRTIWGDHARFVATYYEVHPGACFTGSRARRDADDGYVITGRAA